ncbi:unnamed protein product [Ectocarpus sp. CCAP 1310/34]|nr:unnamed protein product [Ectocarpus sp. CCAP 1310/34]
MVMPRAASVAVVHQFCWTGKGRKKATPFFCSGGEELDRHHFRAPPTRRQRGRHQQRGRSLVDSIMWLNLEQQEKNGEEGQDLEDNGVFFKYVRLGAVRLNVSTTGYKLVRLSEFPVLVAPYARRGKMTNWKRFMHKCIWRMVRHTTRQDAARVFGRIPGDEERSSRQLVPRPGQLPKSLLRRSPRGGDGEVRGRGTTEWRQGHIAHGSGRCSTPGVDSGSSSEEGGGVKGEGEEDEEEEDDEEGGGGPQVSRAEEGVSRCSSTAASVGVRGGAGSDGGGGGGVAAQATGGHAKAPSVDSGWCKRGSRRGVAGKGVAKESAVGAMFRRRLRSVKGSHAGVVLEEAVAAAAAAAGAVSVEEGRTAALGMTPEGEATIAEEAGNDGAVGDPVRAALQGSSRVVGPKGVAEAGAIFPRDRDDRGHSSSSSSSSSSPSPSSRCLRQQPPEAAMRIPVGIRVGRRRRSREGDIEAGGRADGGADAGALVAGGIADVRVGVGRGDGRGDGGPPP